MEELRYIELAHRLNHEHHHRLHVVRAHFRGSINSLSLVSLAKETPELGTPGIRTEGSALRHLDLLEKDGPKRMLGRVTREKEVQAWLIWNALNNDQALYFDDLLRFLTSELAVPTAQGKVVNDILAIDQDGDLVVIELKSTREKKRIEAQVRGFMKVIAERPEFFHALVQLLSGRTWSGGIKGIVVWNASSQLQRKIDPEFREVCFKVKQVDGKEVIDYDAHGNVQFNEYP